MTKQEIRELVMKERKYDYTSPYSYCGTATYGTTTSETTWNIKRIQSLTSGDVVTSATGSWDNRLSLIYS